MQFLGSYHDLVKISMVPINNLGDFLLSLSALEIPHEMKIQNGLTKRDVMASKVIEKNDLRLLAGLTFSE